MEREKVRQERFTQKVLFTDQQLFSAEKKKPQFDAVAALGKNWRLPVEGMRIYLSLESKMTALAAGELFVQGKVGKIIFLTAETAGNDPQGNPYPGEAEEMKRFMRIFFPEDVIPENAIEIDTHSFDTAGNAEEMKRIAERERLSKIALLTVGFHLERSMRFFESYGVRVKKGFASEKILRGRSSHYKKFFRRYFGSERYDDLESLESKVNLISKIDRKGKVIRLVTQVTRHR